MRGLGGQKHVLGDTAGVYGDGIGVVLGLGKSRRLLVANQGVSNRVRFFGNQSSNALCVNFL